MSWLTLIMVVNNLLVLRHSDLRHGYGEVSMAQATAATHDANPLTSEVKDAGLVAYPHRASNELSISSIEHLSVNAVYMCKVK